MANMGQDIKEAMTGGGVPVVEANSVLEENIVNGQVSPLKITNTVVNLLDVTKITKNKKLILSEGNTETSESNTNYCFTTYIPCNVGLYYINNSQPNGELVGFSYDSTKTVIEKIYKTSDSSLFAINVTNKNTKYIRVNIDNVDLNTQMITNNTYPSYYIPYDKATVDWLYVKEENLKNEIINTNHVIDKSITRDKLKQSTIVNVLNPNTATIGKRLYITAQDTIRETTDENWCYTDFIKVQNDKYMTKYAVGLNGLYAVFYDINKEFISYYKCPTDWVQTPIIVPTDAVYMRVNIPINKISLSEQMIVEGEVYPKTFLSYDTWYLNGLRINSKNIDINVEYKYQKFNYHVPETIYALADGNRVPVYYDGLITSPVPLDNFIVDRGNTFQSTKNKFNISASTTTFTRNELLRVFDIEGNQIINNPYKVQYILPTDRINPTKTKNVLFVGDSFIDADVISDEFKKIVVDDLGFSNLNFIGEKNDNITHVKNEGHGGYAWEDYLEVGTSGRPAPFDYNPFWNNGINSVDFNYYMTKNSYSSIDYMMGNLGVNSLGALYDTSEIVIEKCREWVNIVHTQLPNCKIFIMGMIFKCDEQQDVNPYYWNNNLMEVNRGYETICKENNTFCYYVPISHNMIRSNTFQYEMKPPYRGSDETVKVVTDSTHPCTSGYYMMVDALVPCFLYNM